VVSNNNNNNSNSSGGTGSAGGNNNNNSGGGGSAASTAAAGPPKKMSWASVASQPAKPAPLVNKTKKPGVLVPPVLPGAGIAPTAVATKPPPPANMDIGTWGDGSKQQQNGALTPNGPPPALMMGNGNMMMGGGAADLRGGSGGGRGMGGSWAGAAGQPRGGAANKLPPLATFPSGPPGGLMSSQNGFGGAVAPPFVPGGGSGMSHQHQPPAAASHPVLEELRSVNEYNPREYDLNPKNARYFVIKSYSEDDIHRSIKYEIWCSTEHGNRRSGGPPQPLTGHLTFYSEFLESDSEFITIPLSYVPAPSCFSYTREFPIWVSQNLI
jgi:hypothetical protein